MGKEQKILTTADDTVINNYLKEGWRIISMTSLASAGGRITYLLER